MTYEPFTGKSIDALAQCPKCLRTWSYDGLDALMDFGRQPVEGYSKARNCPNCGVEARLFQNLEQNIDQQKVKRAPQTRRHRTN